MAKRIPQTLFSPLSYAEAVDAGLTRYLTGKPCKHGHISERVVSTRACVECERERTRRWNKENKHVRDSYREDNQERIRDWTREVWYPENREKITAQKRANYAENPYPHRERRARFYWSNRSDQLVKNYQWRIDNKDRLKKYCIDNLGEFAFRCAVRRSSKLRATPKWLSEVQKGEMRDTYRECASATSRTGIIHHVDHIVPLKGDLVCGLHVPWNLQIISANSNLRKGNRFSDDVFIYPL